MTDNVVRPPDGFYAVITSAPPSMALWIIQDYVVIPLILIALRFQSKYSNSKAALRSSEVLSRRHRLDLHFFPFTLYLSPRLSLSWSMKPTPCLWRVSFFSEASMSSDLVRAAKPFLGAGEPVPSAPAGALMLPVHIKSFNIRPKVIENELKCVTACDKYVHGVIFDFMLDFSFLDFTVKTCKFIPHLLTEMFFPDIIFPTVSALGEEQRSSLLSVCSDMFSRDRRARRPEPRSLIRSEGAFSRPDH